MKKLVYSLIFLSTVYCLLSTSFNVEAAPVVSLQGLLQRPEEYDGQTIIYKGEVIGDIMVRGEYAWLNVRDETGAIGVFCPKELVGSISHLGGYKFSGDIISVRGTFHRSCSQHGGDTDIHAEEITIVQKGKAILHPLESKKVKVGIVLLAIALTLAILHLIIRRLR